MEDVTPDLEKILYEEKHHLTMSKFVYTFFMFVILFTTQVLYGKDSEPQHFLEDKYRYCVLAGFISFCLIMTKFSIANIKRIHEIKERDGYVFDEMDTRFETTWSIIQLTFYCMIAAILCGSTGIAGGMVLGPLFLKYNMIPQVMSATNQYITLVASVSVAVQFAQRGELNIDYALIFGFTTLICVYTGIKGVNAYIARSGKQSVIAFILAFVLVLALVSLPINFILKAQR